MSGASREQHADRLDSGSARTPTASSTSCDSSHLPPTATATANSSYNNTTFCNPSPTNQSPLQNIHAVNSTVNVTNIFYPNNNGLGNADCVSTDSVNNYVVNGACGEPQ